MVIIKKTIFGGILQENPLSAQSPICGHVEGLREKGNSLWSAPAAVGTTLWGRGHVPWPLWSAWRRSDWTTDACWWTVWASFLADAFGRWPPRLWVSDTWRTSRRHRRYRPSDGVAAPLRQWCPRSTGWWPRGLAPDRRRWPTGPTSGFPAPPWWRRRCRRTADVASVTGDDATLHGRDYNTYGVYSLLRSATLRRGWGIVGYREDTENVRKTAQAHRRTIKKKKKKPRKKEENWNFDVKTITTTGKFYRVRRYDKYSMDE